MNILGIETSCDETSAAIVKDGKEILSSVVASQADFFAQYGGVIPEIASRKHLELLTPVIDQALGEANLEMKNIDGIAYTKEPGLMPALLVGISHAKALSLATGIPAVPINHLEAHVYANSLESPLIRGDQGGVNEQTPPDLPLSGEEISYPHICLLVSGGHTNILFVKTPTEYEVLGSTIDDAAGEAYDKVARLLDLPYPGGPIIDKMAKDGDSESYKFPRPLIDQGNFDFSFSGLKTAVLREVQKSKPGLDETQTELNDQLMYNWKADIAASFQEAVVDVLVEKTMKAATVKGVDLVTIAGGVAANSRLREQMVRAGNNFGFDVRYPEIKMCMDNAAMVAGLGFHKMKSNLNN